MAEASVPTEILAEVGEVNTDDYLLNDPSFDAVRGASENPRSSVVQPKGTVENVTDINTLRGIRSTHKLDILQQCEDIKQHILERGSRSVIIVLRSMLARKLEAVTEAHIQYASAEGLSYTAQQKAYSEFVGKLEKMARQVNFQIDDYLCSREDDEASTSVHDRQLKIGEAKDQHYADLIEQTRRRRQLLEQHLAHQSAAADYGQQLLLETPSRRKVEFDQQQQLTDRTRKMSIGPNPFDDDNDIEDGTWYSKRPVRSHHLLENRPNVTSNGNNRRVSRISLSGSNDDDDFLPDSCDAYDQQTETRGPDDWITSRSTRTQQQVYSTGTNGAAGAAWLASVIPKVEIPPFNGDPKEWPTFISSFRDMIHDVVPSNAQRMGILKQLLTPEVRSYIAEYLSTPTLYYEALSALKKRYGHPQIVARAHLRSLMNLPAIRDDDFNGIAKLTRAIYGAMHSLQSGGYEQDLQSGMVLEQIVDKLPPRMRNNWGVKLYRMMPKRATLRDLAKWLDEFSMGHLMTKSSSFKDRKDNSFVKGKRHNNNNPSVFATTNDSPKCVVCDAVNHKIYSCSVFRALDIPSRADLVKEKSLCFRCLNADHRVKDCRSKFTCNAVPGCKGAHHKLLHGAPRVYQSQPNSNARQNNAEPSITFAPSVNMVSTISKPPTFITLLNVVPIKLFANGKVFKTFALLDNGSDVSLIREDVAKYLNLLGPKRRVTFNTFHGKDPAIDTMTVNFLVKSMDESFEVSIFNASTVPRLNLSKRSFNLQALQRRWPHLSEVNSSSINYSEVTVLIGAGAQEAHQHLDTRIPPKGTTAPYGILTPFGWCCVGMLPTKESTDDNSMGQVFAIGAPMEELHNQVCKFWETDSLGTKPGLKPLMSDVDQQALEIVKATTIHDGVRYIVGLPWISPTLKLPNNFPAAAKRFAMLERRFQKDSAFADRYKAVIEEYISLGHARKVSTVQPPEGRVWYLPHHGVVNPQKPNKVRVVFDASARFNNLSLNNSLLKGPNLLNDLSAVLIRFRQRAIPVSADIQKMFHQVGVREQDQSALRFLWRSPGEHGPIQTYQMQVQIFGAISSPFICAHILQRTAEDNRNEFSDVADKVASNFYVDNLLDSFDTEGEAILFARRIRSLLKLGGFHLNQWLSSSRAVLATLPAEDRSQPTLNLDLDKLPAERTLGVLWDSDSDSFKFKIKLDSEANTKRKILRVVASIFDPLGLLAPVVIIAKKILQDIWQTGADWDDVIQTDILDQWFRWMNELHHLELLSVSRAFLKASHPKNIQLHVFSDASEMGFGAVIYIRVEYNNSICVSFVTAKSRVAPLRPLSIPRLELQGAVVGLRLLKETTNAMQLPIDRTVYWTDSNTVLQWINSKKRRFHTFVANRVAEILDGSDQAQWRHVPGVENPADELSRGLLSSQLSTEHRWFKGPNFLRQTESEWPTNISVSEPPDDDKETKTKWIGHIALEAHDHLEPYLRRSSKFIRVRRVIANVLRFIKLCRVKKCKLEKPSEFLSACELKNAELVCIRKAQQDAFAKELIALKKGNPIPNNSSLIKLTPFLDSTGLLRVGGRLEYGDFSHDIKHPILLPFDHDVTRLVVLEGHLELHHPSKERLLSHLRQRFWIIRGRVAIHHYVHSCFICKKKRAIPVPPIMSALPRHRLEAMQPPFTNTGIDFFGPMNVVILRRSVKRYGLLFTCLVTRAVHIEITHSIDTDSFLMAFQRFQDRRGRPAVIYSDNGTQLVAGEKELKQGLSNLNQSKISGSLSNRGIEWHFSPPAAPHFGGVWESLVKSAKIAIMSVVNMRSLSDEVLLSVIVEVESLLNSRPLTHISVDPSDPEPLTPNHFLLGRASPNIPYDVVEDHQITSRRRWKAAQVIVNHFWQRWLREYLPSLIERRKWLQPGAANLKKGDIVLIADPNTPRGQWPVGHIVQTIVSKDKIVRSAIVKTKCGLYQRPVVKLCLLEAE